MKLFFFGVVLVYLGLWLFLTLFGLWFYSLFFSFFLFRGVLFFVFFIPFLFFLSFFFLFFPRSLPHPRNWASLYGEKPEAPVEAPHLVFSSPFFQDYISFLSSVVPHHACNFFTKTMSVDARAALTPSIFLSRNGGVLLSPLPDFSLVIFSSPWGDETFLFLVVSRTLQSLCADHAASKAHSRHFLPPQYNLLLGLAIITGDPKVPGWRLVPVSFLGTLASPLLDPLNLRSPSSRAPALCPFSYHFILR